MQPAEAMPLRTAAVSIAVGFLVLVVPRVSAGQTSTASAPKCPRYESLMKSAAQSLRAGDRPSALEKLREAKSALDACESRMSSARQVG